jgi:hypothetical protein
MKRLIMKLKDEKTHSKIAQSGASQTPYIGVSRIGPMRGYHPRAALFISSVDSRASAEWN